MNKLPIALLLALVPAHAWASPPAADNLVLVEGGAFKNARSHFHGTDVTVSSFYLGRFEVSQREWVEVMGTNPSTFQGDDLPVEMVSWYECVEYCNKRSLQEGLEPYYIINKNNKDPLNVSPNDDVKWTVAPRPGATGYRLPTEAEWEYAASGGQLSQGHVYSGGDEVDAVAWYWRNSGDEPLSGAWNWPAVEKNRNRSRPVGTRAPNELGLHDMSGNVREWCWDWIGDLATGGADPKGAFSGPARVWKGGGWMGADFCGEPSFRAAFEPHSRANDQGFRVCRDATPAPSR